MTILDKIKVHYENKRYATVVREVSEGCTELSSGYIVDYSKDFIILHKTDDFKVLGYLVLPMKQITAIRFNSNDKYYSKIMVWEKEIDNVFLPHKIDLTNWQTIFKSIKNTGLNVIVECENPSIDTFTIGPISKTTKNFVYILYFSPTGLLDEKPTPVEYNKITKVSFDDRYANVFSKYIRERKKPIK